MLNKIETNNYNVLCGNETNITIKQLSQRYINNNHHNNIKKNVFDVIKALIDKTARIERKITTEESKPKKQFGFLADRE